MTTLQQQERPIDEAIVNALVEATPDSWKAIVLEVVRNPRAGGLEGLEHTIASPEGHREVVSPTDELLAQTMRLADLFRDAGKPWKKVVYLVSQNESGDWRYSADFFY